MLVAARADTNMTDSNGRTALCQVLETGDPKLGFRTEAFGGFPILGILLWGIPIIRTVEFRDLYCGPLILGNYHFGVSQTYTLGRFCVLRARYLDAGWGGV